MSLFDINKLKNSSVIKAFVEFEDKPSTPAKPTTVQTVSPVVTPVTPIINTTTPQASVSDAEMEKFSAYFEELLRKNNLQGPDFLEFQNTVKELENNGIPADMAIKSAFLSLKIMGLTHEHLANSLQHYITIIEGDYTSSKEKFSNKQAELQNLFNQDNSNILKTIEENKRKIKELEEINQKLQSDLTVKQQELDNKLSNGNTSFNSYMTVYNYVIEHLKSYIDKIKTLS